MPSPSRKAQRPVEVPSLPSRHAVSMAPPSDSSNHSPRRHSTSSFRKCGSCNDHPELQVYSQFGPASEDYPKKAITIHRSPRYPASATLVQALEQEHAMLLQSSAEVEPLPPPPSPRFPLPYPTGELVQVTQPATSSVYSLVRTKKDESSRSASSAYTSHSLTGLSLTQSPSVVVAYSRQAPGSAAEGNAGATALRPSSSGSSPLKTPKALPTSILDALISSRGSPRRHLVAAGLSKFETTPRYPTTVDGYSA